MLPELRQLTHAELLDLLVQKTGKVTQMIHDRALDMEYAQYKEEIKQLLAEIESRRASDTGQLVASPPRQAQDS